MTKLAKSEKWRLVRGTDLKTQDRYCLLTLFLFQGDNKHAFCKQGTMAAEMGVTTRYIRRSLKRLAEAGAVFREWKNINRIPMRCYAIDFDVLATIQRNDGRTPPSYPDDDGRTPPSATVGHHRPKGADTTVLQEHPLTSKEHTLSNGQRASLESWIEYGTAYATDKTLNTSADRLEDSFDHYEANGWTQKSGRPIKKWQAACRSSVKNHHRWNGTADTSDDYASVRQKIVSTWSPDLKNIADVEAVLTPEQFAAAKPIIRQIASSHPFDKATAEAYRTARKATA